MPSPAPAAERLTGPRRESGVPVMEAGGLAPGTLMAGCRIERRIGQGGMGTVYLARQLELDRDVALKVVNPGLAGDAGFAGRFRAETKIAARVEHPNVVPQGRVEELFGPPDDTVGSLIARTGAGLPATSYEVWAYELEDDDSSEDSVRLYFNSQNTELIGYDAVTELLETAKGISVGDSINQLRAAYGARAERGPGSFQTQGSFIVRVAFEREYPALVFSNQLGSVSSIEGGDPPPSYGGFGS